jgi:hypothetical protein
MFIPPYFEFNNATLAGIKELGIKILSSSIEEQYIFDQGSSIFNSNAKKTEWLAISKNILYTIHN